MAVLKRAFDILCAAPALVLLAPPMLLIVLAVRLTSRGPAFFRQRRVGLGRREFTLVKFRTMTADAAATGPAVTAGGDARITPVGRLLRLTKLDELPQLWNVLKGDMSLVGPRPEVPGIVAKYRAEWMRVFEIRPGVTDPATLEFRDEERVLREAKDVERAYIEVLVPIKMDLALRYVERHGLALDLWIILRTVWAITLGRLFGPADRSLAEDAARRIRELEAQASTQAAGPHR